MRSLAAVSAFLFCGVAVVSAEEMGHGARDSSTAPRLRLVATFDDIKPAFVTTVQRPIHPQWDSSNASVYEYGSSDRALDIDNNSETTETVLDLLISTFGVDIRGTHPDGVWAVCDIGTALRTKQFGRVPVGGKLTWPNEVHMLGRNKLVAAGGFLVPGKKGHISSLDLDAIGTSTEWKPLVRDNKGAFFHRVEMVNVYNKAARINSKDNGDRMVSCRGRKGVFNSGGGEMVYLEPKQGGGKDDYELRVLAPGCDCFFTTVDYNNDGIPEFLVPQFFGKKLVLMWTDHPLGDYSDPAFIRQRVIDNAVGAAFDVQSVDLNGDGIAEILVSNHQAKKGSPPPSVFAYTVTLPPADGYFRLQQGYQGEVETFSAQKKNVSDFMNAIQFSRRTISSKIDVVNHSFMAAGPGAAKAYYQRSLPESLDGHEKLPVIIVSGDGSEKAYILWRGSESDDYKQEVFHDCKGTVGGIVVHDLDGDGWNEVVVPCYDTNHVAIYSFKP